jgi:stearoyl-CoA desaturase (delta-9 desaturase)
VHPVIAILTFIAVHWMLCVFVQSFYLHRYSAHRMFTLSPGWDRFFYLMTFVCQGASFLSPRAYALLHREHHAFSDTARDPHSPYRFPGFFSMMWATKIRYEALRNRTNRVEARFEGGYPEWPAIDAFADTWTCRILFGTGYTLFYLAFAPHWAFLFLLPMHYLLGPIHGAMVNWGGHKYGYRNFNTEDQSVNTVPIEIFCGGELFQNNHHKYGSSPNFAVRWFEIDPTYQVMRVLHAVGIIQMRAPQRPRWQKRDRVVPQESEFTLLSPADAE